jgi:hypothetical protein
LLLDVLKQQMRSLLVVRSMLQGPTLVLLLLQMLLEGL